MLGRFRSLRAGVVSGAMLLGSTAVAQQAASPRPSADEKLTNTWRTYQDGPLAVVFVHGILSGPVSAFLFHDPKGQLPDTYFPDLIARDPRFGSPSIFLAGYETSLGSDSYGIEQAASRLLDAVRGRDALGRRVLDKPNVLFITHSMGGLVVQWLLAHNLLDFQGTNVGLFMYASPSGGSRYASELKAAARALDQVQAKQMQLRSDFLDGLNNDFRGLLARRDPPLRGAEACENRGIVHFLWWHPGKVVQEESCATYFGQARIIGGTDHISIVKPPTSKTESFEVLMDFYQQLFAPSLKTRPTLQVQIARYLSADSLMTLQEPRESATTWASCRERRYSLAFRPREGWTFSPSGMRFEISAANVTLRQLELRPSPTVDSVLFDVVRSDVPAAATGAPAACTDSVPFVGRLTVTQHVARNVRVAVVPADTFTLVPAKPVGRTTAAFAVPAWATGQIRWLYRADVSGHWVDGSRISITLDNDRPSREGVTASQEQNGAVTVTATTALRHP